MSIKMKKTIKHIIPIFIFLAFSGGAVAQNFQIEVINSGVGGNTTKDLLKRIDTDVIEHQPDLTILMVGTNDLLNSRKMISFEEYRSNLDRIIKAIKASGSDVLLMSSPPVDTAYLFNRHDKAVYTMDPNKKMDSVCVVVNELAIANGVFFLNLQRKFKTRNIPKHNEDLFIRNPMNSGKADGVHPTELGYNFIAENILQFMKEHGLLKKYLKIVCFGDSITRGDGVMAGGTVSGKNYPSFLYQKLNTMGDK